MDGRTCRPLVYLKVGLCGSEDGVGMGATAFVFTPVLAQNIKPLIWVECLVEKPSRSRTEYLVKARSQFKDRSTANNVEIILPLPADATTPIVKTSTGSAL